MAKKGGRRRKEKLEPPLPETKDELNMPRYFGIIRGSGFGKTEEPRKPMPPSSMPEVAETPKTVRARRLGLHGTNFPNQKPDSEMMPMILLMEILLKSILKLEQ